MKTLIGKKVKVTSDNDCYDSFRDKILIITHASNSGYFYDESMYPKMLCDFEDENGNPIPNALYEYEFELI